MSIGLFGCFLVSKWNLVVDIQAHTCGNEGKFSYFMSYQINDFHSIFRNTTKHQKICFQLRTFYVRKHFRMKQTEPE